MKNNLLAFFKALRHAYAEMWEGDRAQAPSPTNDGQSLSEHEKPSKADKPKATPSWWEIRNAEAFRDQFSFYANRLINTSSGCEKIFGSVIDSFFIAHDGFMPCLYFSEIHMQFLRVQVYNLHEKWNSRTIPLNRVLRDALAKELDAALVYHACHHLIPSDFDYHVLISGVWLLDGVLFIALPLSAFPIVYPNLAQILASEKYWATLKHLNARSIL